MGPGYISLGLHRVLWGSIGLYGVLQCAIGLNKCPDG